MSKRNRLLQFASALPTKLDGAVFWIISAFIADESYMDRLKHKTQQLQSQNQFKKALKVCNRALALSPSNPAIWHSRGEILESLGRTDEAIADYSRSLSLRMNFLPDDPETFYYRGFYNSCIGRYEDAIADYNRALTFNPNNVMVIHNRAIAYSEQGKLKDALEDYDRACTLTPDAIPVLDERARLNHKLQRNEAIVSDIRHINTLIAPDNEHLYRQGLLMVALFNLKQFEQALDVGDLILSFTPDNPTILHSKSEVLHKLGRLEEALSVSNRAVYLEPDNTSIRADKVLILYGLQRLEEAIYEANIALSQQPNNVKVLSTRALLYAHSGQMESGKQDLLLVKAIDPSAYVVQVAEARFLAMSGETRPAIDILANIIQEHPWSLSLIARDPIFYNNLHTLPEWQALITDNIEASDPSA